jgi:hypothetical protein
MGGYQYVDVVELQQTKFFDDTPYVPGIAGLVWSRLIEPLRRQRDSPRL